MILLVIAVLLVLGVATKRVEPIAAVVVFVAAAILLFLLGYATIGF